MKCNSSKTADSYWERKLTHGAYWSEPEKTQKAKRSSSTCSQLDKLIDNKK